MNNLAISIILLLCLNLNLGFGSYTSEEKNDQSKSFYGAVSTILGGSESTHTERKTQYDQPPMNNVPGNYFNGPTAPCTAAAGCPLPARQSGAMEFEGDINAGIDSTLVNGAGNFDVRTGGYGGAAPVGGVNAEGSYGAAKTNEKALGGGYDASLTGGYGASTQASGSAFNSKGVGVTYDTTQTFGGAQPPTTMGYGGGRPAGGTGYGSSSNLGGTYPQNPQNYPPNRGFNPSSQVDPGFARLPPPQQGGPLPTYPQQREWPYPQQSGNGGHTHGPNCGHSHPHPHQHQHEPQHQHQQPYPHTHQHYHNHGGYEGGRGYSTLDHSLKTNTEYTEVGHHQHGYQGNNGMGYGSGFGGTYNGAYNRPGY